MHMKTLLTTFDVRMTASPVVKYSRRLLAIACAAILVVFNFQARAELSDTTLKEITFDQYPGRQVPLDTVFTDSSGHSVKLGDCFSKGQATILVPGYFRCKMLCEGVTDGLIRALQGNRQVAGRDFRIVYISIDPKETTERTGAEKDLDATLRQESL